MTDDAARHISREGLAALEFYRDDLGLDTRGVVATEFTGDESTPAGAIAIFELADGLLLALYPRTELAKDANIRSNRRQRAGSASATSLVPKLTSTPCSSAHKRPAQR